jgi:hypothetical protein
MPQVSQAEHPRRAREPRTTLPQAEASEGQKPLALHEAESVESTVHREAGLTAPS